MAGAEFMVLVGDTPLEIPANTSDVEIAFDFSKDLEPNVNKPSMLILNIQGLVASADVSLNGKLIGKLNPSPHLAISNKLTSSSYSGYKINTNQSGTWRDWNAMLADIQINLQTTALDYWTTQMIKLGEGKRKQAFVEESGESRLYFSADDDNLLTISSVSEPFKIKDVVFHYHTKT